MGVQYAPPLTCCSNDAAPKHLCARAAHPHPRWRCMAITLWLTPGTLMPGLSRCDATNLNAELPTQPEGGPCTLLAVMKQ